jgi:hypothetical protein
MCTLYTYRGDEGAMGSLSESQKESPVPGDCVMKGSSPRVTDRQGARAYVFIRGVISV